MNNSNKFLSFSLQKIWNSVACAINVVEIVRLLKQVLILYNISSDFVIVFIFMDLNRQHILCKEKM